MMVERGGARMLRGVRARVVRVYEDNVGLSYERSGSLTKEFGGRLGGHRSHRPT